MIPVRVIACACRCSPFKLFGSPIGAMAGLVCAFAGALEEAARNLRSEEWSGLVGPVALAWVGSGLVCCFGAGCYAGWLYANTRAAAPCPRNPILSVSDRRRLEVSARKGPEHLRPSAPPGSLAHLRSQGRHGNHGHDE